MWQSLEDLSLSEAEALALVPLIEIMGNEGEKKVNITHKTVHKTIGLIKQINRWTTL